MSGKKRKRLAPSATPWDGKADDELSPAEALVAASHRSMYEFRHSAFEGDAAFFNSYARDACPWCGSGSVIRFGIDKTGLQRYRCKTCSKTFTPATGTIFDDRKLPLSAWADFLVQVFSYESSNAMTREDRRSITTVPYWMAKLFSVLDGIQDGVVLSGRVQIDETYYPVPVAQAIAVDGKKLRGLSRNKLCIGVGCDSGGRSLFDWEGYGKTSGAKTWGAFGGHVEVGSTLAHDMEKGHRRLVRDLSLVSEEYSSKELARLPDKENPLRDVNRLCFLLKGFLDSHSGFDRADLPGYLNVFHVMMNDPADKMEKAAMVLDRAMSCPKTLRFREFYRRNP
ncbi:MAG: IS1 family transposase [Eggerthellaceae bacterium]|nr:IS1 family transposase [Eggerthellaceae bacterium]